jgi:hypothetical protein
MTLSYQNPSPSFPTIAIFIFEGASPFAFIWYSDQPPTTGLKSDLNDGPLLFPNWAWEKETRGRIKRTTKVKTILLMNLLLYIILTNIHDSFGTLEPRKLQGYLGEGYGYEARFV